MVPVSLKDIQLRREWSAEELRDIADAYDLGRMHGAQSSRPPSSLLILCITALASYGVIAIVIDVLAVVRGWR